MFSQGVGYHWSHVPLYSGGKGIPPDTIPPQPPLPPSTRTTKVGGMYPTGMLSGYYLNLDQLEKLGRIMHVITYKRSCRVHSERLS